MMKRRIRKRENKKKEKGSGRGGWGEELGLTEKNQNVANEGSI